MSSLREQLRQARTGHLAATYPGNLAVDVLWNGDALRPAERVREMPPASRSRMLLGGGLALSGVAAVLAMFIWIGQSPRQRVRAFRSQPTYVNAALSLPSKPPTPPPQSFGRLPALRMSNIRPPAAALGRPATPARPQSMTRL